MDITTQQVTSTSSNLSREQRPVGSELDGPPRRMTEMTREEAIRELEALRQRGIYKGPGSVPAERSQALRPEQYVREDAPVVEERVRSRAIHEVVPEVRREREVAEIRHAVLPIREHVREDRTYSERELEEIREREQRIGVSEEERRKNRAIQERLSRGYRDIQATQHEYVYRQPRVEEVVKPRIIHEVHPVLQREVDREHYEREILPIRERIVEGPRVSEDVEILRPIDHSTWASTHGRDLYEREGWRYGREASSVIEREPFLREMYPPGISRRTSVPVGGNRELTPRLGSEGAYSRYGYPGRIESGSGYYSKRGGRGEYSFESMQGKQRGGNFGEVSPFHHGRRSTGYYRSRQSGGMGKHLGRRGYSPSFSSSSYSSDEEENRRYRTYREPEVSRGGFFGRHGRLTGGGRRHFL